MAKPSPCHKCPERFIACCDNCPVDKRGEYGYHTWLAEVHKEKAAEREYKLRRREDYLRSEECKEARIAYTNSKTKQRRGDNHGR